MASSEIIIAKPSVAVTVAALKVGLPQTESAYVGIFVADVKPGPRTGHESLPTRFVRVTRAGGGMINRVTDNARMLIECWSEDSYDSEVLANCCRAVLDASRGERFATGWIRGTQKLDDGPVSFPDPLVPSHERHQFTIGLLISTN